MVFDVSLNTLLADLYSAKEQKILEDEFRSKRGLYQAFKLTGNLFDPQDIYRTNHFDMFVFMFTLVALISLTVSIAVQYTKITTRHRILNRNPFEMKNLVGLEFPYPDDPEAANKLQSQLLSGFQKHSVLESVFPIHTSRVDAVKPQAMSGRVSSNEAFL